MRKVPKGSIIANYLHKGFVNTCIAATVVGSGYMAYRGYVYLTEVRPQFVEKKKLEQQKLLAEGSWDSLKDPALEIRS
ncbi:hypothetical protein HUJ04_005456 [Dendroctonus ponderosae]|nr:hypothetical protein HUJ04_005456 [Dendroctonus ponderosae]KAH1004422.1 hypothetical protein HUJ05_005235 [Dendroctonus ponderosae]